MQEKEMLDYLLSTGFYKDVDEKHPYDCLYYEQKMMNTDKTVSIKELVEKFVEVDKEFNGEPWNIVQILANIRMVTAIEDR